MGRRKQERRDKWWKGVEKYLRKEKEIRKAVNDERAALSYICAAEIGAGRKGGRKTDRTAALVIKKGDELPAVVLQNGETVKRPESWIKCFDEVRRAAKDCERPEWILDDWRARYDEGAREISELISGKLKKGCCCVHGYDQAAVILWIIESVEAAAVRRGLLAAERCLLYGRPPADFLETCPPQRV